MIADVYVEGTQLALTILKSTLPLQTHLSLTQLQDVEQFISDLEQALDDEAERQYIERTTY
jgi:hypothetical protein